MVLDTTAIKAVGAGVFKSIAYGVFISLFIGLIVFVIYFFLQKKRYEYVVRVWKKESDNDNNENLMQIGTDKAGVILDKKTNNRLLKFKNLKYDMSCDSIPYFYGVGNVKVINILQKGLKEYVFLEKPCLLSNSPEKIGHGVQDKDIAFAINEIERAKMFEKKSTLEKLLPFIGMAFVFLTVVVALYFLFVKAGFNADMLKQLVAANTDISQNLLQIEQIKSGTVVVPGGG